MDAHLRANDYGNLLAVATSLIERMFYAKARARVIPVMQEVTKRPEVAE